MKTFFKIVGGVVLVVLAVIAIGIIWLMARKPASRPASAERVQATPERMARGKYLVEHVSPCLDCHSDHVVKFGVPVKPNTEGQGGLIFDKNIGFPGVVAAQNNALIADKPFAGGWEMKGMWGRNFTANLTPAGPYMSHATREEFIGRFKSFASMDANTAPDAPPGRNTVMPWLAFAGMTDHDLGAIYDYLKTVKPIENKVVTFPDAK